MTLRELHRAWQMAEEKAVEDCERWLRRCAGAVEAKRAYLAGLRRSKRRRHVAA